MDSWDHRAATSWAKLLGLVTVPLFGRQRKRDATGEHFVLLDGRHSSLTFSRGDASALLTSQRPLAWAWSANVPRSVIVDEGSAKVYGVRWDRPQDVREASAASPDKITKLLGSLETSPSEVPETSVSRALVVFRSVRKEVREFGGTDLDAIHAFNLLLVLADLIRHGKADAGVRCLADAAKLITSSRHPLLAPQSYSTNVGALPIGDLAGQLLGRQSERSLDPYLMIRHASGTLFQEAHIALGREPRGDPKLFISLQDGLRAPTGRAQPDAHYTPAVLARFLTELAIGEYLRRNPNTKSVAALDPACGSGVFLVEAMREVEGKGISIRARGIDSSPLAKPMADFAVSYAALDFASRSSKATVSIEQGDSLELNWGSPDVVLMNPPFLPWKNLKSQVRMQVRRTLGKFYIGRADTAIAFLAKAARELRVGGVLAAVIPAAMLQSKAALKLRRLLTGPDWDVVAIGRVRDYGYFANAIVEPAFVVLSKVPKAEGPIRTLLAEAGSMDQAIRAARTTPASTAKSGDGWELGLTDVLDSNDWTPRAQGARSLLQDLEANRIVRKATSLFDVHLGARTGDNSVFIVPASLRGEMCEHERALFRPVADEIKNGRIQPSDFMFYPYRDGRVLIRSETELRASAPVFYRTRLNPARASLEKRRSLRDRYWWELSEPRTSWLNFGSPRIVSTSFGRRGAFAWDEVGEYAVHQGQGWIWKGPGRMTRQKWLAYIALLNSSLFESLLDYFCPRTQGGQYELAPRFLARVPLPDIARLNGGCLQNLAGVGADLHAGMPYLLRELDATVASAYGVTMENFTSCFPLAASTRLELEFSNLVKKWKEGRGPVSLANRMAAHPAYRQIMQMGEPAIPLILAELEREVDHWFIALHEITGANPVRQQSRGKLLEMAAAWLEWGRQKGYRW